MKKSELHLWDSWGRTAANPVLMPWVFWRQVALAGMAMGYALATSAGDHAELSPVAVEDWCEQHFIGA